MVVATVVSPTGFGLRVLKLEHCFGRRHVGFSKPEVT